jgi:hypothetical protein
MAQGCRDRLAADPVADRSAQAAAVSRPSGHDAPLQVGIDAPKLNPNGLCYQLIRRNPAPAILSRGRQRLCWRRRRIVMAKGQQRSNKEARKPKKAKVKNIAANPSQKSGVVRGLENFKN